MLGVHFQGAAMPISPVDLSSLSATLAQFKGQAMSTLFEPVTPTWNAVPLVPTAAFGSVLDQVSASLRLTNLPTSTTPTGLDASQSFSRPGQNMVTVLNRVEVSFKAQFSELGEMRKSLIGEQDAARKLSALGAQSPPADITLALDAFVASHNAGVKRFAPAVAKGGILEGSWAAARARFVTERDINYILNGSELGLKGGLAALGISADPTSGLASIDHAQLDAALAKDKGAAVSAITAFAGTFVSTVDYLNAPDHAQLRQMGNLERAVHWIDANRAAVQKEFGPGQAATPDEAFAKAAARYDDMAQLINKPPNLSK
jgi:hypothetical protein